MFTSHPLGFYRTIVWFFFWAAYRLHNIFHQDSIVTVFQDLILALKCRFFIFISFCAVTFRPKNIETFFECWFFSAVISDLILIFHNNIKSDATMVTPEFRCIILKRPIKGKIMSRKYFGCGSPQKFLNRINFFLTKYFYLSSDI